MSPSIINIFLWVPFAIVLFIAAIIFCISGYKRGIWRALISLGITMVSALISVLISKLIAGVLSGGVYTSLSAMLPEEALEVGFVVTLVQAMVQAIVAILLFSAIFFVLTLIFKIVGNVVKQDALRVENKGMKWAGLGVRAVDAVLYTFLLLLPLYGTLGAYMPTAQTLIKMDGEENQEMMLYLSAVTDHPLVAASNDTPIGMVYGQLASVKTKGADISIPEVVDAMETTMTKFEALSKAPEEQFDEACLDLVKHLKENVVEADWCYDLMKETSVLLKNEIASNMQNASPEEVKSMETVVGILDMSKEEFSENGVVVLDFVEYALQTDLMTKFDEGNVEAIQTDEFYKEAATFLNATELTSEIKKYCISELVSSLVDNNEEAVSQIMNTYNNDALTTEEMQKQEIESLISLVDASTKEEVEAAVKNIPSIDGEKVLEYLVLPETDVAPETVVTPAN